MIDGLAGRPFSAETLAPESRLEESNKEAIIQESRKQYGTEKKFVEERIIQWAEPIKGIEPALAEPQVLYDAQCQNCKRMIKVPFKPDGVRPVYCKTCLEKIKKTENEPPSSQSKKEPGISLNEAVEKEPIFFSPHRKVQEKREKPKRREVNTEELKEVLKESLKKEE